MAAIAEPTANHDEEESEVAVEPERNVLIVTGNGFDIACRLETQYYQFMLDLIAKNFGSSNQEFSKIITSSDNDLIRKNYIGTSPVTIWEFYLATEFTSAEMSNLKWFDIEAKMTESFEKDGFWDQVKDCLIQNKPNSQKGYYNEPKPYTRVSNAAHALYNTHVHKLIDSTNNDFKEEGFYDVLLTELNKFEKKFVDYLKSLALENKKYERDKKDLFDKIIKETEKLIGKASNLVICTFNYTSVADTYPINYVHGNLNNAIFGIDNAVVEDNYYLTRFTKQNRRNLANPKLPTYDDILNKENYTIVFYGTSFADSDASDYNLMLQKFNFDHRNDDRIIVCYSNFGGQEREKDTRDSFGLMFWRLFHDKEVNGQKLDFDDLCQQGKIKFIDI